MESSGAGSTPRKLIAHQRYFGLEARVFHAGAERMLKRIGAQRPRQARIDVRSLSEDFGLDAPKSAALLRAFLAGGLLYPDGGGGYEASERFRVYALAQVVVPLTHAQAKAVINAACQVAEDIDAAADRNPILIETMAVSGAYTNSHDLLAELSLWLVLRRRPRPGTQRSAPLPGKNDACRQIEAKMRGLSPVLVVRIVSDKRQVERPFTVVFQAKDEVSEPPRRAWERLRDWGASLGRRPVSTQADPEPRAVAPMELVSVQRSPRTPERQPSVWGKAGKRG